MRTTRGHLNSINRFDLNYVNYLTSNCFHARSCSSLSTQENTKKGKKTFGISTIFDFTGENFICTMDEGGWRFNPKKYDGNRSSDHFILHFLYLIYTFAKVCMHSDAFVIFFCSKIHLYVFTSIYASVCISDISR